MTIEEGSKIFLTKVKNYIDKKSNIKGAQDYYIYSAQLYHLVTYDYETKKMTINRNFNFFYGLNGVSVAAGEVEIMGGADNQNPMYLFFKKDEKKIFAVTAGKGISWAEQAEKSNAIMLGVVSPAFMTVQMSINIDLDFFEWKNSGFIDSKDRRDYLTKIPDKIIVVGDSLTAGSGASDPKFSYFNQMKKGLVGITMYNEGVSSSTWQNSGNATLDPISFATRVDSIDWTRANLTVILLGINDHSYNLPIGTIDDDTDRTMLGAANISIKKIYEENPKMKFKIITPPFKCRYGTFPIDVEKTPNEIGKFYHEYVDAIIEFSNKWGFPYYDLYRRGNLNMSNWQQYIPTDGLHWNDAMHEAAANDIAKFITGY